MVRKIFIYKIIVLFLFFLSSQAWCATIDEIIQSNPQFHSSIIGISVKDANTGKVIYQKNAHTLLHPASTLKRLRIQSLYPKQYPTGTV